MTDNGAKYDYVGSEIWVRNWDLAYLLRKELDIDISPETPHGVSHEDAIKAWKILKDNALLIGTYGDKFLNEWKY